MMKLVIAGFVWPDALIAFNRRHPDRANLPYAKGLQLLMTDLIGAADFYSFNLNSLGHSAQEIVLNDEVLQRQWLNEHGLQASCSDSPITFPSRPLYKIKDFIKDRMGPIGKAIYPFLRKSAGSLVSNSDWWKSVLVEQISQIRPDVFLTHAMPLLDESTLKQIRPFTRLIVGQHASPIPDQIPYAQYDLIISSLPHQVDFFKSKGVPSEYLKWCFEASLLQKVGRLPLQYPISFVGGFSRNHAEGTTLFEELAGRLPIHFWGYGADQLPPDSPILKTYHGHAWGQDMYKVFAQSKIVLNRHINVAGRFANNMRLFEATGMGSMLLTDMKDNLHDLFEIGKEVVAYRNVEECEKMIRYYLEHEDERAAIAKAGQQRTLREHTYRHRMSELVQILERQLSLGTRPTSAGIN